MTKTTACSVQTVGEQGEAAEVVGIFQMNGTMCVILLEIKDEWAAQCARYMRLEIMALFSDDGHIPLPAGMTPARSRQRSR